MDGSEEGSWGLTDSNEVSGIGTWRGEGNLDWRHGGEKSWSREEERKGSGFFSNGGMEKKKWVMEEETNYTPRRRNGVPVNERSCTNEEERMVGRGLKKKVYIISEQKGTDYDAMDRLQDTHEAVSSENLSVLEGGTEQGSERLMGAVIIAGENTLKISCVENYFRDSYIDPHAEPLDADPSSVPTDDCSTQYPSRLKIVKTCDIGADKKLVFDVRAHNYLVTSGSNNGNVRIGLERCVEGLKVNSRTRLLVKR